MDYLEWIEFSQFDLVINVNKRGSFSSIYSAVWLEGPAWNLDEEADVWTRNGPIKVILKRLDNSHNIDQGICKSSTLTVLHGGNILVESEMDSIDAKILDTGLHGPADSQILSQQVYGVIPFIAPEIFNGNMPTKESDVYSFG